MTTIDTITDKGVSALAAEYASLKAIADSAVALADDAKAAFKTAAAKEYSSTRENVTVITVAGKVPYSQNERRTADAVGAKEVLGKNRFYSITERKVALKLLDAMVKLGRVTAAEVAQFVTFKTVERVDVTL